MDIARGFNAFGLRLFGELPSAENCFLSPLSVALALSALLPGTRGDTGRELAELLGLDFPAASLPDAAARLLEGLVRRRGYEYVEGEGDDLRKVEKDIFRLHLANALFVQRDYALVPAYVDVMRKQYRGELRSLDFGQAERSAALINRWIAEHTEQKIPQLVSPEDLDPATRLVLVNAIYFLAEWAEQFEKHLTSPAPFQRLPGSEPDFVDVPTMRNTADYAYVADDALGLEALSVPYQTASLLVLLPRPGRFAAVEQALDGALLARLDASWQERQVELHLPRFEFEWRFELSQVLRKLGVRSAFDAGRADFSGISADPEGLVLSRAIHGARIKVDEWGTEAAAATALMDLLCDSEETPETIPFFVDRPFFFAIRDNATKLILFLGRVVDPS